MKIQSIAFPAFPALLSALIFPSEQGVMSSETAEKIAAIFDRAKQEALSLLDGQDSQPRADSLLTAKAVASKLQTNTQAVYRMAREGKLLAVKLSPRSYRWTEETVTAFIKQQGQGEDAEQKPLRLMRA